MAVLAAMLVDREAIAKIAEILLPDAFYRQAHATLYGAMMGLFEQGDPVDPTTVRHALGDQQLEAVGGYGYLIDLAAALPTTAHVEYYARIVADKAMLRALIRAGTEVVAKAYQAGPDVDAVVDEAERTILEVGQSRVGGDLIPIKHAVHEVFEDIEARSREKSTLLGVSTGFYDLDHMLSGFNPSDLLILAARPAMGKTSLALNFVRNVAHLSKKPVLVYSLEMGYKQLVSRMLSSEAGVDSSRLRTGYIAESDWGKLTTAIGTIAELPIYIEDASVVTVNDVRLKARRLKAEHGDLGLVMIDYLQLMSGGTQSKGDNRTAEMGAISRGLKQLARELNVPVIALSQLSRGVESRTDKRPMLSDLRESGSIEQDADIVMFIYRDEYYHPDSTKKAIAEVIVAKHRNGPVGKVELYFEASQTKFENMAKFGGEQAPSY